MASFGELLERAARALRPSPAPPPAPFELAAWLDALDARTAATGDALIIGSPALSGWRPRGGVSERASPLGEARLEPGASYESPALELPRGARTLVIRMRALTESGRGQGRISILSDRRGTARPALTARFEVVADGIDRLIVVSLERALRGAVRLSLTPLDEGGEARVLALGALGPRFAPPGAGPPRAPVELGARRRELGRALARAAHELAVGDTLAVLVARDAAWTRAWLARELAARGLTVERLEPSPARPGETHVVVRRVAARGRRGVDVVIRGLADLASARATVESVLRHTRNDVRITLVDDGRARELSRMFGELAAECPRVEVRARAEPAVSGARDVVLIEGEVRVFRGFLRALRAAARAGEAPGLACALPGPSAADKHLAALARRTARPSHPLLERGFPGCVYFSADALSAAGELDAGEPSARAQAAGFPVRLAAAALVAGTAPAPTVEPAVRRALDELEFHARRAPRAREAAVLVLLSAPPAESGADGARVLALVERLALPRVLLAYPGEGGIALAEVLDGAPEATHYRVTRPRAPARALRAILSDYRVGHVLGLGLEAWPPHALRAIIRARRPLTVDLTFAPGVEPAPCPSPDAWLAGYRRALASTSSQVRVGRLRRGELRALAEARRPRPA